MAAYPQVEGTLGKTVQAALRDKVSVNEALSSLEADVTRIVQGDE